MLRQDVEQADWTTGHRPQASRRGLSVSTGTDAILALGVILQGKTSHAQNLSRSVTDALQRIALEHGVPVINAVLSLDNETQARERCLEEEINRGTEAARAAIRIVHALRQIPKGG